MPGEGRRVRIPREGRGVGDDIFCGLKTTSFFLLLFPPSILYITSHI